MISSTSSYILNNQQYESLNKVSFGQNHNEAVQMSSLDSFEPQTAKKIAKKKNKKLLCTLGGLTISALSLLVVMKIGKASQVNKALQSIDAKFGDLCADIPKARKTLSEVFLRSDLTEKETLEILNRYKEIEKLGVTSSKEEYFQAIFNEAKHNYGLGLLPTEFRITNKPLRGNDKVLGFTDPLGGVSIRSFLSKSEGFNTIHHELRHLKQKYYAFHYAPTEYVKASQPRNMEIPQEVFEHVFGTPVGKSGIPNFYIKFAENSAESIANYCPVSTSSSGYFVQWAEKDAYKAGNDITRFFGIT